MNFHVKDNLMSHLLIFFIIVQIIGYHTTSYIDNIRRYTFIRLPIYTGTPTSHYSQCRQTEVSDFV